MSEDQVNIEDYLPTAPTGKLIKERIFTSILGRVISVVTVRVYLHEDGSISVHTQNDMTERKR